MINASNLIKQTKDLFGWILKLSIKIKIIFLLIILGLGWLAFSKIINKPKTPEYQTAQVEKGTLILNITSSGQASSINNASVTTEASGVVSKIYVENGQAVKAGDPIAELDLDIVGKQRSLASMASYQSGQNNLESAKATLYSLQSTMFTDWKTYMDIAQNSTYQNSDKTPNNDNRKVPEYMSSNDDWLFAQAKYKNQQNVINQAQISLNSAWMSYQQSSPIIYAPISGTVTGLSLQIGSVLTSQSNSSGGASSQKIASIKTAASPTISVNLNQVDAPKVTIGNKATVTFDAFPDMTFTGKVISIDTIGAVSSGVTTYPAVIKLDTDGQNIFPNMTAQASIITQVKNNVLLVPLSALQTQNNQSFVRILKDKKIKEVNVEVGLSSNTQVEIISGIQEGDTIVTSIITSVSQQSGQTQSPFSSFGGNRNFGGAANRNVNTGR